MVVAQANIALGLTIAYKALGGGWQLRTTTSYRGVYPLAVVSADNSIAAEPEMIETSPMPEALPVDAAEEGADE